MQRNDKFVKVKLEEKYGKKNFMSPKCLEKKKTQ